MACYGSRLGVVTLLFAVDTGYWTVAIGRLLPKVTCEQRFSFATQSRYELGVNFSLVNSGNRPG